jgi:hypothetical protein
MKPNTTQRRHFLKLGSVALAALPLLAVSAKAVAATNAGMRGSLKYQGKPEADKQCSTCTQFVPGKSAADLGGCKLMPGDTEIAPQGYCVAWVKK